MAYLHSKRPQQFELTNKTRKMDWKSFDVLHPDSHRECLVWGYYQLPDGARIRITCPAIYRPEFKMFMDRDGDDIDIDVTHWIDYREITGPSTNKQ